MLSLPKRSFTSDLIQTIKKIKNFGIVGHFQQLGQRHSSLLPPILHQHAKMSLDRIEHEQESFKCTINSSCTLSEFGMKAEEALGSTRWSMSDGLSSIFAANNQIISLYTLQSVALNREHPLNYLAELIEADTRYRSHGGRNPFPLWRKLMVYLLTDIFGLAPSMRTLNPEARSTQLGRIDRIGKIIELAYVTEEIHKRVVDLLDNSSTTSHQQLMEINRANKVVILIGDFLWTRILGLTAATKSQQASTLMTEFLAMYCESEFYFGVKYSTSREYSFDKWISRTRQGIGSLIKNTVILMLHFNGHGLEIQRMASNLAILLSLTYQAYEDIRFFTERSDLGCVEWIDHGMLPVVLLLQLEPHRHKSSASQIFELVKSSHMVIANSHKRLRQLQDHTLLYVEKIEKRLRHEGSDVNTLGALNLFKDFIIACSFG